VRVRVVAGIRVDVYVVVVVGAGYSLQSVAVRCSVLQCVAVRCSVLQCVAGYLCRGVRDYGSGKD